jgi:hypothetical protein
LLKKALIKRRSKSYQTIIGTLLKRGYNQKTTPRQLVSRGEHCADSRSQQVATIPLIAAACYPLRECRTKEEADCCQIPTSFSLYTPCIVYFSYAPKPAAVVVLQTAETC